MCDRNVLMALEIKHETDSAYFVSDGDTECWLPKSQVQHDEEEEDFLVPEWLAIEKGLV